MSTTNVIPPEVYGYDWAAAFECCGPVDRNDPDRAGNGYDYGPYNEPDVRAAIGDEGESREPFTRSQIERVFALAEGDNDGPEWVCLGRINDGRYFALTAGCDYTGWDCQSGGSATIASSLARALEFGFTPDDRERLVHLDLNTDAGLPRIPDGGYPKDWA